MHRQLPSVGRTVIASIAPAAMWSKLCFVVIYLAIAATEGHPDITKRLYQNELQTNRPHENQTNVNDAKENSIGLNSNHQQSTKSHKKLPAPAVDDDLLEFLVRIADNPAEWNKIRRVLNMLGRGETGTSTTAVVAADENGDRVGAAAVRTTSTSTPPPPPVTTPSPTPQPKIAVTVTEGADRGRGLKHQPLAPRTTSTSSWPAADWIMKTVQDIKAAARARGIGAGGEDYDGDDDGNDYDYDDQTDGEIEQIEEPTVAPPIPPPSRPPMLRTVTGHMSRYEFKRLDGRPDDGRVNGTYVAVIESERPPRVVIYDPARQKKPKTDK